MLIDSKAARTLVFICALNFSADLIAQVISSDSTDSAPDALDSADIATAQLKTVGTATLRAFFWDIYDSELLTKHGNYQGVEPGLALNLIYKRAITSKKLVTATEKEWRKLTGSESEIEQSWSTQLLDMWPNIEANDEILLYVDDHLASHFYFNGNKLGVLQDAAFTEQFLAIWLSPETSYPKARAQLLGLEKTTDPNIR